MVGYLYQILNCIIGLHIFIRFYTGIHQQTRFGVSLNQYHVLHVH